jgi:hypothetical protein
MKYHNKRIVYEGKNFASHFEAKTYQNLKMILKFPFEIRTQYKITLKPKTALFRAITWVADFAIFLNGELILIVEAKGFMLDPFILKMGLLEYYHPQIFEKIILVVRRGANPIDYEKSNLPVLMLSDKLPEFTLDRRFQRDFLSIFNRELTQNKNHGRQ